MRCCERRSWPAEDLYNKQSRRKAASRLALWTNQRLHIEDVHVTEALSLATAAEKILNALPNTLVSRCTGPRVPAKLRTYRYPNSDRHCVRSERQTNVRYTTVLFGTVWSCSTTFTTPVRRIRNQDLRRKKQMFCHRVSAPTHRQPLE